MIVAADATESGAALIAFLIFPSLVVRSAEAVVAVVEAVVDAAAVVLSAVEAAGLLHAARFPSDTTKARGRKVRMVPSDLGGDNKKTYGPLLLVASAGMGPSAQSARTDSHQFLPTDAETFQPF
jgi:hypothetical protein